MQLRYLSGTPYAPAMRWEYGGVMFTPVMRNVLDLDEVVWAADNGCYTMGDRFSEAKWLAFLDRWRPFAGSCCFAVAPDVPFDASATWERSTPYFSRIRERGYRAALAVQNGVDVDRLDWSAFDAVFIAGSKDFKTSPTAWRIVREAKRRGMHAHYARGNSLRAIQAAHDMGCDTIDGTFLRFAPDYNWQRMQRWFAELCPHQQLASWDSRYGRCLACGRDVWRLAG